MYTCAEIKQLRLAKLRNSWLERTHGNRTTWVRFSRQAIPTRLKKSVFTLSLLEVGIRGIVWKQAGVVASWSLGKAFNGMPLPLTG